MAWLASGGSKCNVVRILGPGANAKMPQPSNASMTCHWDLSAGRSQLAYAAGVSAALWTLHQSGSVSFDDVMSARVHGREQQVDRLAHDGSDGTGWWLGGVAGAGTTLAYSKVDVEYVNKLDCLQGGSCKKKIAPGGGIYTVSGAQATMLPGSVPALELAAAGNLIAYVPATAVAKSGAPAANRNAPIEIVDTPKGTLVSKAQPDGVPLAIALAPHVLAVLTLHGHHDRVTWYAADTGTKLGSATVPLTTAPTIGASDGAVVYRVGRSLREIVLASSRTRRLSRLATNSVGPSVLRNRLVWAENTTAKNALIRQLFLR